MRQKKWPVLKTDEEAERFVAGADLTEYDFSEMVPMRFEIEKKSDRVNMRVPTPLLDAVKERAQGARHPLYAPYPRADGTGNCPAGEAPSMRTSRPFQENADRTA